MIGLLKSGILLAIAFDNLLFHFMTLHGIRRQAFMFCSFPFDRLKSPRWPRDTPPKVYQRFDPRPNFLNSLRHLAHSSPEFYRRGQKVLNLASISTTLAFDALWFRNGAVCRKPKTTTWSIFVSTQTIPHPSHSFTGGGQIAKFGLNCF